MYAIPDTVEKRIAIERRIIRQLVTDAIKQGYTVSLSNGEEWVVKRTSNVTEVMLHVATTDEDTLRFRAKADMGNLNAGDFIGDVWLVYGNDGHDVISNYNDNSYMRALLSGANQLADTIAA